MAEATNSWWKRDRLWRDCWERRQYSWASVQNSSYPPGLSREKNWARWIGVATVVCDKGCLYKENCTERRLSQQILKACHSEPISGHFGLTKTWKRITERFYWKEIVSWLCKNSFLLDLSHKVSKGSLFFNCPLFRWVHIRSIMEVYYIPQESRIKT